MLAGAHGGRPALTVALLLFLLLRAETLPRHGDVERNPGPANEDFKAQSPGVASSRRSRTDACASDAERGPQLSTPGLTLSMTAASLADALLAEARLGPIDVSRGEGCQDLDGDGRTRHAAVLQSCQSVADENDGRVGGMEVRRLRENMADADPQVAFAREHSRMEVERLARRRGPPKCCQCSWNGSCIRCACATSGRPCSNCLPLRRQRCANSTVVSSLPSSQPMGHPTCQPTSQPAGHPTSQPTNRPNSRSVCQPKSQSMSQPGSQPMSQPTSHPMRQSTSQLMSTLTGQPPSQPTIQPTSQPTSSRASTASFRWGERDDE